MKKKDKAKLTKPVSTKLLDSFKIRLSKNETLQIIPKVNSRNQIKSVNIVKFKNGRAISDIRINRQSLRLFLSTIKHFSDHIDEESIDPNIREVTRQRIC